MKHTTIIQEQLEILLKKAEKTHHALSKKATSADHNWQRWYAKYLIDHGVRLTTDFTSLYIPVIEGTKRKNRMSINVARLIVDILKSYRNIKTKLVDPVHLSFPNDGNDTTAKDPRFSKIINKADGFFIVVPEYNHSFPGSLKRMLDSEYEGYRDKPVAFAGVSSGSFGGARAIEALLPVVRTLGMIALHKDIYFPFVQNLFTKKGVLKDKSYKDKINKIIERLLKMAVLFKKYKNL